MADPAERAIHLSGRNVSVLLALTERELDLHGARVSATRLEQARGILASAATEELEELARRLERGLQQVWGGDDEGAGS